MKTTLCLTFVLLVVSMFAGCAAWDHPRYARDDYYNQYQTAPNDGYVDRRGGYNRNANPRGYNPGRRNGYDWQRINAAADKRAQREDARIREWLQCAAEGNEVCMAALRMRGFNMEKDDSGGFYPR